MSDRQQNVDHSQWRQLLDLGARLMAQPTGRARQALVVETAEQLLGGQADLWLAEARTPPLPPAEPSSEAMRRVYATRQPFLSEGDEAHPTPTAAVPLLTQDALLGVLQVTRPGGPPFSAAENELLHGLAIQTALVVHTAQRLETERQQREWLLLVREVSAQVASLLDLDDLLDEIVQLLHQRLGYSFVHLFTVDPVCRRVRYRAGSGLRSHAAQQQALSYSLDDPEGMIPWVARHGQTVLANDVQDEPRYRPFPLPPANTQAELTVPLIFGGEVLGVLDVQSDRRHAFSEQDRFLLEALADSVAIAIRNANLYRSEQWRRQVADGLREVTGLLAAGVDLDQMLKAILTELEGTLPSDVAAIWLLRHGILCLAAVHGFPGEVCIADFSPDSLWLHQALQTDQPTVRTVQSPYEPLGAALGFPPDYSAIAAPLRAGDRHLGLLTLAHRTPGRYGPEARAMTATFASTAAVAIENTRLYQTAQEQAYVSTALLQVAEAIQSQTTLDDVLQTIVRLTPMLTGVPHCALLLWQQADETFVPAAAYGLTSEQQALFDRWIGDLRCAPAFDLLEATKAPIFIPDALIELGSSDVGAGLRPALADCGFPSPWLVPLAAHGEILGAMLVDYRREETDVSSSGELGDLPLAILRGIAYQAAAAVANTRLLQERQEEAYVSVALLQVAQAVVSLDTLQDILKAIVRITTMLAGVQWCAIFLWNEEQSVFQATQTYGLADTDTEAYSPTHLLSRRYAPGDFPLLDLVRQRDSLLIHPFDTATEAGDPSSWSTEEAENAEGTETLHSFRLSADHHPFPADFALSGQDESGPLVAAPLSVVGDVLGVLLVAEAEESAGAHGSAHRAYGHASLHNKRLELITGIARQAALAVQNDRLLQERAARERLDRELQLAHELQRTFMPEQVPHLPGWELAATWQAAREVGGDFYDFFELPGGRLGLVIADVADKGMPAALFMSLTRTLVRAAALEHTSPAAALDRVNALLLPDAQEGMFVTAAYSVLSLESGQLTLASAGHNPPLLLRSGGREARWLRTPGTVLGVLEELRLQEQSISLEAGNVVIFYTDGITEAFSPQGDIFGEQRLQEAAEAAAGASAQAMLEAICDAVGEFVGDNPPSDDLTLMILRRLP